MLARLAGVAIFILVAVVAPATAQLSLDRAEARALAQTLLAEGQPRAAREIAIGLLREDQTDFGMLLLLARADRAVGRNDTATWAATQAWKQAGTEKQRFAAAMVRAQVLSSQGNRTMAQVWLRRAAEIAPDAAARALAIRDFRYVRWRNPLSVRLSFGARPSSNINNGSKSDRMVIGGLPFTLTGASRALSGMELSYGISASYRKPLAEGRSLRFGLAFDGRAAVLSDAARAQAPDAENADFAYQSVELRFGGSFASGAEGTTHVDFVLGQNWYGGNDLSRFARANLAQDIALNDTTGLRLSLQLEDQHRLDSATRSSQAVTLRGDWSRALGDGQLGFGLGLRETVSDSVSIAHSAALASASYSLGQPVLGAETTFSLALEARDYEGSAFGTARADRKTVLGVSFLFSEVDYLGFAPVIRLTAERNASNLAIYDTEGLGLSLGIQSVF